MGGGVHARRFGARLALALLVACSAGCEDPPATTNTTFLSPGSGIENTEPLWPMQPGWIGSGANVPIAIVNDPITIRGETLLRFAGPLPFLTSSIGQVGPAEPADWSFFSWSDEGLLLRGFLTEGIWDAPILFLPKVVRVGMIWDARLSDGTLRYRFSIDGVEYRRTRFGPRRVWTLGIYDARALVGHTDRVDHGLKVSLELIEGRGPNEAAVVPLDAASPSAAPPRLAVKTLNGGGPVSDGVPTGVDGIVLPGQSGSLIMRTSGTIAYVDNLSGVVSVVPVAGTACSSYTPGAGFQALEAPSCPAVAATVIAPNGQPLTLGCVDGGPPPIGCFDYEPAGIYADATGQPIVLGSRFDRPNTVATSELAVEGSPAPLCCAFLTGPVEENETPILEAFGDGLRFGGFAPGVWITPISDELAIVGETNTGYLGFGRVTADRAALADVHFDQASHEPIRWRLTAGGREGVRIDPDGRVDLLSVDANGIGVRRVDLDLAPGDFLGGAIVHEGKLLGLVSRGFKGNPQQFTDDGYDPRFGLDLGATYLVEADMPATPAVVTPSARFGIRAERPADIDKNGVARVCIPPGDGALTTDDWTINGEAPRYATPSRDGSCVSLLFDPPETLTDMGVHVQGDQDPYDVIGAIPTVGRVSMWPQPSTTTYLGPGDAPLATGGSITRDGRVRDELGFLETVTDDRLDTVDSQGQPVPALADLAGGGLWGTRNAGADLVLIHRGGSRRWPGLGAPLLAMTGGGIVVAGGLLRAADGAPTALPALPPFFDRRVVLADGTQCGFTGEFAHRLGCVDPAGDLHESTFFVGTTIPANVGFDDVPFFAVGETLFVVQSGPTAIDHVVMADKTLTAVTRYPAQTLGFVNQHPLELPFVGVAPDGDAYMAIGERVLAFRAAGIESADLPKGVVDQAFGHDVFATNGLLIFHGGGLGADPVQTDKKVPLSEIVFAAVDPLAETCPPDLHACGVNCYPDQVDDVAIGCRLGCGAACEPPPFATANCTAGKCDFTCDALHPRVGDLCSCTPLACDGRVCGAPDCGSGVSCGTCPNANDVCSPSGQCGCSADAYEVNDVSAALVTRLENGVHSAQILGATLTTPADVDLYDAYCMDPGFQATALHFTATIAPGLSHLKLEVGFNRPGCSLSCVQGATIDNAGIISCAATASAAPTTVEMSASCPGLDDNGSFVMVVTAAGALDDCGAYSVDYSAVAQ